MSVNCERTCSDPHAHSLPHSTAKKPTPCDKPRDWRRLAPATPYSPLELMMGCISALVPEDTLRSSC